MPFTPRRQQVDGWIKRPGFISVGTEFIWQGWELADAVNRNPRGIS